MGDLLFIIAPPFVVLICLLALDVLSVLPNELNNFTWVLLILMVDVGHVYSSLYRTYFDPLERKKYSILLILGPICCFATGVFCYGMDPGFFWRMLAYVAVFHFVRQQYGFMRLYSRMEKQTLWQRRIDVLVIYALTLYPMWYWHTHDLNISWFTDHDFIHWNDFEFSVMRYIYVSIILLFLTKEGYRIFQTKELNITKNLVVAGTGLSWYFGIVYFEGDLAFTALNVISHGVPYMALVWFHKQKETQTSAMVIRLIKLKSGWIFFLVSIIFFAYLEETCWDAFVWQEHVDIFPFVEVFKKFDFSSTFIWLVPLLSLPQTTHYLVDGYIWKRT